MCCFLLPILPYLPCPRSSKSLRRYKASLQRCVRMPTHWIKLSLFPRQKSPAARRAPPHARWHALRLLFHTPGFLWA